MRILTAGPLTAGYENGFLRRISYGGVEILRMIYFALRDHNWNTMPDRLSGEDVSVDGSGFSITYDRAHLSAGATVLEWRANLEGKSDGTIVFEIHGLVRNDFRKNRAGFCVLHPLNVPGMACTITTADGTKETAQFPVEVSPTNPFRNMREMQWEVSGVPFSIVFEGDLFETEDQRNWGDASFKTFCTPLDKPFPVEIKRGEKIFQRITFRPLVPLRSEKRKDIGVVLRETGLESTLPFLGIAASTEFASLGEQASARIRALNFRHYRVDVFPANEQWVTDFSRAYETGFALGIPLEIALHLTSNCREETEAFIVVCLQNKVRLRKVLLLNATGLVPTAEMIRQAEQLKAAMPRVSIGAGTNYNFNELNKNRFSADNLDFVSFSIDPQEHAIDDLTILENAETAEHLVSSTRAIYGQKMAVHVSPVTLRKRFNPYATDPADLHLPESAKADPRQKEDFAALWTFGCLCSLAKGGAAAVTFYQTAGDQGIVSKEGSPYPVYETLKQFASWQGKRVGILESSEPLNVQGILLDGKVLALVNLSHEEKTARYRDRELILRPGEIVFEQLHRS